MKSNKKTARLSGLLYLLVIIFGIYAELYVRAKFIIPDNTAATVENILTHAVTFRMGFVSDLLMQVAYFFLAFTLYHLFKNVNKSHALLMLLSVVISVAIMCINMLHQYAAIILLEKENLTTAFDIEQVNELVLFTLTLQKYGYRIAQIFFGIWLFPLGYLVYQSGRIPKWIGILLMIGCFSFLLDFFLFFLVKNYSSSLSSMVTLPTTIAEFSMCLWLLIVGIR
ncbi:MAG: DUF4386 domain-containing protein [Saprospiraceae bacterium]